MNSPISILSAVDFDDEPLTAENLYNTAQALLKEHGYVQIINVPTGFDYIRFGREFGNFVPNYGGAVVGNVRPEPGMDDVYHAGNHQPLTPHTEGYDFKKLPPRYIMLWCVVPAAGEGGETTIATTEPWIEALDEETREYLFKTTYSWKTTDGVRRQGLDLRTEHPILEDHGLGRIVRFSCNNLLHNDDTVVVALQKNWQSRFAVDAVGIRYAQNDILLWDNWHLLHARNAFKDSRRHLRRLQISAAGGLRETPSGSR
ncbi:TauD/TfdA family dioxygenase [Paucibacter sp. B2R-40]|uniref:TauD/TfdA family dioxygenase n=1 Tax=Paucibacter sp. B2R-40 TaxID=2893554 RepID=UPI0021E400F3|nr:TauD/TfdA family dioxygenase [Paucibacter sp. B2R-40]MCV2353169.1 TauD/TfdA family dioxygenase [Paucibacter sp. B2R-40]